MYSSFYLGLPLPTLRPYKVETNRTQRSFFPVIFLCPPCPLRGTAGRVTLEAWWLGRSWPSETTGIVRHWSREKTLGYTKPSLEPDVFSEPTGS